MRRIKKFCCTTLILGLMLPQVIVGQGSTSEAATGTWKQDSKGWWYSYTDGSYAKNQWLFIGKSWYYFGKNGYMVTGWKLIDKKWYYFNKGGAMQTGWKLIDKKWYYFSGGGAMQTGWKKLSGIWYYFAGGAMATGWKQISGDWYFFDKDGAMFTGWKKASGKWYYLGSDGIMVTGFQKISDSWYYFETSGEMVASSSIEQAGTTYHFGSNGKMTGKDHSIKSLVEISEAEYGDTILLGKYEQDYVSSGKEDIEWIVLDKKEDGSLFVMSKYGLDMQPYHSEDAEVTWETCSLRKWLNNDFYNAAFTKAEKEKIQTTTVESYSSYGYGYEDDPEWREEFFVCETKDKVFLPSYSEAVMTPRDPESAGQGINLTITNCKPTAFAVSRGAYVIDDAGIESLLREYGESYRQEFEGTIDGNCGWWLRYAVGNISFGYDVSLIRNFQVNANGGVVRPAMWITP